MSKKKAAGKARQHKRPEGKRLGVKVAHGQKVVPGNILMRQRGTKFASGAGTRLGRDFTIYSTIEGIVTFGQKYSKKFISVLNK